MADGDLFSERSLRFYEVVSQIVTGALLKGSLKRGDVVRISCGNFVCLCICDEARNCGRFPSFGVWRCGQDDVTYRRK